MTTITDTQFIILSAAAKRAGNIALPLPEGLVGAAAKMAVGKMIESGWLQVVEANLRRGEPMWRETSDGHGTTLIATDAGFEAIGIEPITVQNATVISPALLPNRSDRVGKQVKPRAGTKQAQLIAMLQRPKGASIPEIASETGWQYHTIRGAVSGALKKKLGLAIVSQKIERRGQCYSLAAE